jgi:iron-sulfur cluster repair protein YtfE (RIC family)
VRVGTPCELTIDQRDKGGVAVTHEFIEHLLEDHEEQRQIGEQLRTAKDPQEREELRKEFYEALYPHMIGEEASIFPYMQEAGGEAQEEAMGAVQEHHVAKLVLRELMDLTVDNDIFKAKASVLDEMNRHHMEKEEEIHFPMLERMADEDQLDELFDQYEEAEEEVEEEE